MKTPKATNATAATKGDDTTTNPALRDGGAMPLHNQSRRIAGMCGAERHAGVPLPRTRF
jgi:hypothetical protein